MREFVGKLIFGTPARFRMQSAVQRLMHGPRMETVRFRDGHLFDCMTSEKYWWYRDGYEGSERRAIEAALTPETTLFDVGANAGFWEVVLASRCRHIYAFEPSPRNFGRLSRNIEQNHLANVTAVPAAASDASARLRYAENGSMSRIAKSATGAGVYDEDEAEVDAIRLDEYAADHETPAVVKIDIEGHAGAALRGMRRVLAKCKPTIFLELHDTLEADECHSLLDALGYKFFRLSHENRFPYCCRVSAASLIH